MINLFAAMLLGSAEAQVAPDLSGTWKIDMTVASTAQIPVLGHAEILSRTTMVAHLTPQDGGWRQWHETCGIWPESSLKAVQTRFPRSFVEAIPEKSYVSTLSGSGAYRADFGPLYIGYDPRSSGSASPRPPQDIADPAVRDFEGDGLPGATIHLQVPMFDDIRVYITQHTHTLLEGQLQPDGTIRGKAIVVALDQRSIGAEPAIFSANAQLRKMPEKSVFTMTRVADGATCADLVR